MRPRAKQSKIAAAVRIALLSSSPWLAAHAGTLPVACPGGPCGSVPFVSYGSASYTKSGSKGTVTQTSTNAILNWASFNISAGNTVQFVQPTTSSVALNEIYDTNPTQIFGALDANGQVFLINQNGIVFGAGATVNVGGLVASTLQITSDAAVTTGSNATYSGLEYPAQDGEAAFQALTAASGQSSITVEQGATLESAEGGEIYLFAPNVTNLGTIQSPGGQTILAAGTSVYLASSADTDLRGMVVEVGGSGTVTNGLASNANVSSPQQLVGQIVAQDGNISLAALAVNQYGLLNATTSVSENGSIYLQARNGTVTTNPGSGDPEDQPGTGGTLTLGQNSDTEVTLDTSSDTTETDSVAQLPSTIMMSGYTVDMLQGSVAQATGGVIDVYTDKNFDPGLIDQLGTSEWNNGLGQLTDASDGSRFYMAPGSVLDVSGASTTLPVGDNVISADLESTELADSPLQRGGPLQGQTIYFDIDATGTDADGTWWGTPLADVEGEILAMGRNVVERNLDGGTVNIQSQGDVILSPSSNIDISGGYVQYTGGYIDTSELVTIWGQTVPVASASPDVLYAGIVNSDTTTDAKWGVTQTYQTTPSSYSPGYVQGYDAGTLKLSAPAFIFDGTVSASTVVGPYQTQPTTPIDSSTWVQESTSTGTSYSMYRPYDEVPAGATLVIGTPTGAADVGDYIVDNVTITPGEVLPGLENADGSAFNPLTDPLPASFTTSTLQPSLLDEFQNVEIYTNGTLTEPAGVSLSFAAGGSFTAQAASIDIEGGINVPSGTISLTAEPTYAETGDSVITTTLTLGPDASLTATGEWINDSTALYPNGNTAPVYINGGSVSLTAASPGYPDATTSLQLDPGSLIDVSGGAQLTSTGTLDAGTGGGITIDASTSSPDGITHVGPLPPTSLELGATLLGYGLYDGGSLSISAAGVCIAASDCSGADPTTMLWLTPQFFNSGGFASYSITADQNGLTLASGLSLELIQSNLELAAGYAMRPDASSIEGFSTVGTLPLELRQPVDLSLALYYPSNLGVNNQNSIIEYLSFSSSLPSLVVPQGDVISTDPGGSISLASDTELDVEGVLSAPGGAISLTLDLPPGSTEEAAYDPAQAIWLGPDAVLDASGADEIFPNSIGDPTGSVLAGGTVSLSATIGSLELLPGSVIDVAGTSGTIDVMPVGGGIGADERIASAGGTIALSSSDGGVIGGTLLAAAGTAGGGANQPGGGSLSVTADAGGNSGVGPSTNDIVVSPTLAPTIVSPGSQVPDALQGLTLLPANTVAQGGFSIVSLTALDSRNGEGEIAFSGGATLTATEEVSLDAPTYTVEAGTTGGVDAPYVEFGNSFNYTSGDYDYSNSAETSDSSGATGGSGTLDVSGGFIQLYGTSVLQGIGSANFDSSGDLQLVGIQYSDDEGTNPTGAITGGLYTDGTINLTAQQIYPSTLTQFVISADPDYAITVDSPTVADLSQLPLPTTGSITIQGTEGANTDLLSAGGSLILAAASIEQNGVLRAPFGTIELDATTLILGPDSLTSTSANGLTIPFGTTEGNTGGVAETSYDWVYSLLDGITTVYGTDGVAPPSQHIELNGANIDVQTGAVIDISGGGDLEAYEWVPGPGGTQDVLDCSDCYAIIPSLEANVAPYDPWIDTPSTAGGATGAIPQVGEEVHLSAGSGVPAGTYILLPARYALLPGAYLVTEMSGTEYQDMQPGQTFQVPDGGTIVSGYLTELGTPYSSSRLNGFEVTPSSVFLTYSQYELTTGNSFFSAQIDAATASAADEAASAMRLPQDAGVLDINAGISLTLDVSNGSLLASGASGVSSASGGEVDISNPDIVVANTSGVSPSGALVLTSSSLDQLGAQTLLLGGENDDGTIDTTAQSVTILGGASLTVPQVLLTAENQVSVDSGASITASGTAPSATPLTLENSGAFLSVSAGPEVTVTSTGVTQGTLDLASGSSLTASQGSIYLDATAGTTTAGSIAATGGALAVQAPQIALGDAPSASGTTVLGQNVLQSGDLASLLLTSSAPIAVYQDGSVSAQSITIDAPGLVSDLSSGQSATISATGTTSTPGTLTLGNSQGTSVSSSGSQSGSLTLSAADITLQSAALTPASATTTPTFGIEGFSSVALDAQDTITAENDIDVTTDGALSIMASQITTAAGVNVSIEAGYQPDVPNAAFVYQPVELLSPSSPASPPTATGLGGSLSVTGSTIDLATEIDMPSGDVALTADAGPLTANAGNITVDSGGQINVAGVVQQYGTTSVATPGGNVTLSAAGNGTPSTGDITLASGSSIDVSAGTGGIGGSLSISATNTAIADGTLAGSGAAQGGSFSIEASSFGGGSGDCTGFCAISAAVTAGGFTDAQSYWLQGSGDLTLDGTLTASTVLLEADQGMININGEINASGTASGTASNGSGGSVTLSAGDGIVVNGQIDANATTPGENGGTVELDVGTVGAPLTLGSNSIINVSGDGPSTTEAGTDAYVVQPGTGGTVLMQVQYNQNLGDISGVAFDNGAQIEGASSDILEANYVVSSPGDTTDSNGDVDITTQIDGWMNDVQTMVNNVLPLVPQLNSSLISSSGVSLTLEPGLEIDAGTINAPGNIVLDTNWDLTQTPILENGVSVPGILTLRATGSVTFNDSLSDGVTTTGTLMNSDSWSYRIVAGADLNAANPLAVTTSATQPAADVTIGSAASAAMVRTGTGFIDVAASGDFVLANPDSVLYTAGEQDTTDPSTQSEKPLCGGVSCGQGEVVVLPSYAVDGGNIDINVDGDIDGAAGMDQFVNDWLWRQGGDLQTSAGDTEAPVAWSVEFADFEQDVGALAGGNVTVHAGGDIDNFSASIASIGVAETGGSVDVKDGGTLSVSAGGSILGGSYYVGAGSMTLAAGDSVGSDTETGTTSPLIGLGEASVSVTATGDLEISDIVSPTLLNSGASESPTQANNVEENYFSTYGSASSASLTSIGGNVTLDSEDALAVEEQYSASFYEGMVDAHIEVDDDASSYSADSANVPFQFDAMPPVLDVYALSGDIDISRNFTVFPSSQDNLELLASGNVNIGNAADMDAELVVPDVDPSLMPSIDNPDAGLGELAIVQEYPSYNESQSSDLHGSTPLFSSVSAFDENPVQVVALNGNITFVADGDVGLWSGKPVIMSAGGDITDPNIYAQNLTASDVTSITAGGDITYPQERSSYGTLVGDTYGIEVAGPGEVQVTAGGNVDLGTSSGIVTIGNVDNSALPSTGASISVEAGVAPSVTSATAAQYSAFITQYIDGSSEFDGQLVSYVEQITGQTGLTDSEAKQAFAGMTSQQQRTFVEQLFFYLLQTYGTEAVKSGDNADYASAYAAIQTLFPGDNSTQSATNPFLANGGDISLYFSEIYTKDGGDISLLAPGGEVNAGLAVAPTSYGLDKAPQDLGIVAERGGNVDSFSYGDFEVNESRVFAADGGDILVWSQEGNIDAGAGSKTSLSASAPSVTYDTNGFATVNYYPPTTGSGIQALADTPGVSPGTVYLFAPHGVVNAGEAGIVAGNLVVGAVQVLGTNNIQVSGTTFGVPTAVTGLGTVALGASTSAAAATSSAQSSIAPTSQSQQQAPQAAAELRWLDVFVLGFGEQTCSASDIECLKRQKHHPAH